MSSLDSASAPQYYHENGSSGSDINYTLLCLERVVDEYFRTEGETTTVQSIEGIPSANANYSSFVDSLTNDTIFGAAGPANETLTGAGSEDGTAVTIEEIQNAQMRYDLMKLQGMTDMTFEDYLATYGVTPKAEELHKPELIRYVRDWTYPTNTIDPTSGAPRSACSWVINEKADKDRFFREPGFLFGVTVTRPKVYLKNLSSSAVMLMKSAQAWLPPSLMLDPLASFTKVAAGDPPCTANTDAYWVDIKDLLLYGDQFVNFATSATDFNGVDQPLAAGGNSLYPGLTAAQAMFVDTVDGASGGKQYVREDGIVSLSIAGRQVDTSPNTIGTNVTV